ncbi:MAG: sigma-70 family RNA polymerase sigma factor, partial [Acidobacteriota bacterium]
MRDLNGKVYNMAYRYTRRFDVAEELTQDVFLKVFQNLSSYRPGSGPLRNWVMRVGRNLIIDRYRATRHEKKVAGSEELEQVDFHVETGARNPFESVYLREKAEFLMSGLESLTTELREAVTLRDIEGLAYLEIAQLLEIPEGTVKSRINRGRIELTKILRKL